MKDENKGELSYDIAIMIPPAVPYNSLEIQPVLYYEDENLMCFEICKPEKAKIWSVYLHLVDGRVVCIADCKDQLAASNFAELIKIIAEHYNFRK